MLEGKLKVCIKYNVENRKETVRCTCGSMEDLMQCRHPCCTASSPCPTHKMNGRQKVSDFELCTFQDFEALTSKAYED